jgi:hypothetical protein
VGILNLNEAEYVGRVLAALIAVLWDVELDASVCSKQTLR